MDINKINQAKTNFKNYLNDELIKKVKFDEQIYKTYITNSEDSLEIANDLFKNKKSELWIIVISYYSMFYIANAYLMKIGFKVGHKIAHKVTSDSLINFLKDDIKNNLIAEYNLIAEQALEISENLVESFEFERVKRSKIQYETTNKIKYSKAKTSLTRAKEFKLEIEKLIENL